MFSIKLLSDKLNNHKMLARFLLSFPALIVLIYVYFFALDTINAFKIITYNDQTVQQSTEVYPVISHSINKDGEYELITDKLVSYSFEPETENIMYISAATDGVYYTAFDDSGKEVKRKSSILFDSVTVNDEDTVTVILADEDNTTLDIHSGDPVYLVSVTKEGNYLLHCVADESIEDKIAYVIDGLEYDGDTKMYIISDYYYRTVPSLTDFYPCSTLETDGLYYDVSSEQLLQNISSNFVWAYLLSTKIYFVVLMVLVILVLFKILQNKPEFELDINTKPYFIVNNIALIINIIAGFLAWCLLSK